MTVGDDKKEATMTTVQMPKMPRIQIIFEPDDDVQLTWEGRPHIRWPENGRTSAYQLDWFSRLVASGRDAVVLTNGEAIIHRARRIVAENPKMLDEISVWWGSGVAIGLRFEDDLTWPKEVMSWCWDEGIAIQFAQEKLQKIGLTAEDESNWPKGFVGEALDEEKAIRKARSAYRHAGTGNASEGEEGKP